MFHISKDTSSSSSASSSSTIFANPVEVWTTQRMFQFPPALSMYQMGSTTHTSTGLEFTRLRSIHEEPKKNTQLYQLLSQYNPWLDCEMTREKREYLKPRAGEFCYPVYPLGGNGGDNISSSSSSTTVNANEFFRNETVIDIVNLYLWPLLYSRSDDVISCKTFSDWKKLFSQTISLAFPGYSYWCSVIGAVDAATSLSALPALSAFISVSDQRRTAQILQYLNPARVLYLLTTSSNLWPYGGGGLCVIKHKIKNYTDKTEIDWIVSAEYLRKMKRIHIYFTYSQYTVTASLSDSDSN
jgi:hypothetical protein